MSTAPTIRSVKARAVTTPLKRPLKNAFGVFVSAPLVLIDVATDQGVTGRSYIFAYAEMTQKPLVHLIEAIGRDLAGKAIVPFDLMAVMDAKFRLLGWQGLVGMAVSGLDMAYWDALGQVAGKPVVELLGGSPRPVRAYDSYGVVDPNADEKDLRRSLEQGFRGIKIKGGDGDAAKDEHVVKGVRALLGPDIALMIDFNQSLDPAEATRRIARLAPYDLHWVEEPVAQENLLGHAKVRETSPIPNSVRRELVVSARLRRSDRGRRERLHHARPDEGRRRHRLAPRGRSGGRRVHSDVEPPVRRSECASACRDADGALAGSAGSRRRHPGDPIKIVDGTLRGDQDWASHGTKGGREISGVRRRCPFAPEFEAANRRAPFCQKHHCQGIEVRGRTRARSPSIRVECWRSR